MGVWCGGARCGGARRAARRAARRCGPPPQHGMLLRECAEADDARDVGRQHGGDLRRAGVDGGGQVTGEAHRLDRGTERGRDGTHAGADRQEAAAQGRCAHGEPLGAQCGGHQLHLGRAGAVGGGELCRAQVVVVRSGARGGDGGHLGIQCGGVPPGEPHVDVEHLGPGRRAETGHARRDLGQLSPQGHFGRRRGRAGIGGARYSGAGDRQRGDHGPAQHGGGAGSDERGLLQGSTSLPSAPCGDGS